VSAAPEPTVPGLRLASHPRATAHVRYAKGIGALTGFALAAYATDRAGGLPNDVLMHGLEGGVAGLLVSWTAAVTAWRALLVAEMREARARMLALAEQRAAADESQRAARSVRIAPATGLAGGDS